MKNIACATILVLLSVLIKVVAAEDITIVSGKTYTNASVTRVEPDGISVMHSTGITKLSFSELTPDMQKKYNYDPQRAATHQQKTRQAQIEWARQQQAASMAQLAEQQSRLDAVKESESQQEAGRKLRSSAKSMRVEVLQILNGGGLCIPYDRKKAGFTPGRAQYVKEYGDSLIFIEGLPPDIVDNEEWSGRVAETGTYQYESVMGAGRTVRRYKVIK